MTDSRSTLLLECIKPIDLINLQHHHFKGRGNPLCGTGIQLESETFSVRLPLYGRGSARRGRTRRSDREADMGVGGGGANEEDRE